MNLLHRVKELLRDPVHGRRVRNTMVALLSVLVVGIALAVVLLLVTTPDDPFRWMARVGGTTITRDEAVARLLQAYPELGEGDRVTDQRLLVFGRLLVRDHLLLREADRRGIEVPEEDFKQFESFFASTGVQHQEGTDREAMRKALEADLRLALIREALTKGQSNPSDQDIAAYYQSHLDEYRRPSYRLFRRVVVRDLAEAQRLREQLLTGANFEDVAARHSITDDSKQGGLMPPLDPSLLDHVEYGPMLLDLRPGEISGVVDTSVGYQVFRLEEEHPQEVLPLAEVRPSIIRALSRRTGQDALESWLKDQEQQGDVVWNPAYYGNPPQLPPLGRRDGSDPSRPSRVGGRDRRQSEQRRDHGDRTPGGPPTGGSATPGPLRPGSRTVTD